jgi:uncharacterized membrane protein
MADNTMTSTASKKPGLFQRIARPFMAGLLAAFPLVLTLGIVYWLVRFIHDLLGPKSDFGRLLGSIGLQFVTSDVVAYLIGLSVTLALIYLLGLLVEAGMKNRWNVLVDTIMQRVPLVSTVYDTSKKLIRMFDQKGESEMKAMSPVLCHFGGERGTAVLALMPSEQPIHLDGYDYLAVLIPTAPIPFGGALLYVPADWVKPVDFAVDGLFNVYMTMGVTSPDYLHPQPATRG